MQATVNVLGAKLETSRFETLRHLRHAETKSSLSELLVTGKAFFAVTVTEESLRNCPSEGPCDDRDDNQDVQDDQDNHEQRTSRRNIEKTAKWKETRDAEVTKIQDHFYRVKAKLLSCEKEEFFERAPKVDAHILAAFRELEDVPDRAQSTVANRYPDDPKRRQRPKTPPLKRTGAAPKRPAAAGGGNSASHAISDTGAGAAPAYAFIQISDSEDEDELRNGGAPSSD